MGNVRPFVTLACICEKFLQEKDGVGSIIRVIDTFYLEEVYAKLPPNVASFIEFSIVVGVKSGQLKGSFEIGLSTRYPSGLAKIVMDPKPVLLMGDEHGVSIVVQVRLEPKELGLYWFDVIWNGETLTSIPLKLALKGEGHETRIQENSK